MFIIFILYHILYVIFHIKKQKNQFIPLPIEEGDFLIRLLKKGQITLEIHATQSKTKSLKSPRNGLMIENIKEGLSGTIHLKLYKKQVLIYEDTG